MPHDQRHLRKDEQEGERGEAEQLEAGPIFVSEFRRVHGGKPAPDHLVEHRHPEEEPGEIAGQQMPAALFAGMFGFTRKEFYDLGASRTEVEAAPTVKF